MLKVKTSDGKEAEIPDNIKRSSKTIMNLLEDCPTDVIELPFTMVIWLYFIGFYQLEDTENRCYECEPLKKDELPKYQLDYLNKITHVFDPKFDYVFEGLIQIAQFLDNDEFFEYMCTFARHHNNLIEAKYNTEEEKLQAIRDRYGFPNDLTPEEIAEIKEQNKYIIETDSDGKVPECCQKSPWKPNVANT